MCIVKWFWQIHLHFWTPTPREHFRPPSQAGGSRQKSSIPPPPRGKLHAHLCKAVVSTIFQKKFLFLDCLTGGWSLLNEVLLVIYSRLFLARFQKKKSGPRKINKSPPPKNSSLELGHFGQIKLSLLEPT